MFVPQPLVTLSTDLLEAFTSLSAVVFQGGRPAKPGEQVMEIYFPDLVEPITREHASSMAADAWSAALGGDAIDAFAVAALVLGDLAGIEDRAATASALLLVSGDPETCQLRAVLERVLQSQDLGVETQDPTAEFKLEVQGVRRYVRPLSDAELRRVTSVV